MLSLRAHLWIFFGFLAGMILLGVGGNLLAAMGWQPALDQIRLPLQVLFLGLVLGLAFSFIPVMVKLVLRFQVKAGRGEVAVVKAVAAREQTIIWAFWILLAAGLAVAIPAAVENGMFDQAGSTMATATDSANSEGTLVAAPGMAVADMLAQSTLKLAGGGAGDTPYAGGAVFDFRVAGTDTVLHQCRYYFISRESKKPEQVEALSIGTAPHRLTRAQLDAANETLRQQLKKEGWLTGHEEYKTAESQQLHGGATRGEEGWVWLKNHIILHILTRRMDDAVAGEDPATAGSWIQFIDLWPEAGYPGRESLVFPPASP